MPPAAAPARPGVRGGGSSLSSTSRRRFRRAHESRLGQLGEGVGQLPGVGLVVAVGGALEAHRVLAALAGGRPSAPSTSPGPASSSSSVAWPHPRAAPQGARAPGRHRSAPSASRGRRGRPRGRRRHAAPEADGRDAAVGAPRRRRGLAASVDARPRPGGALPAPAAATAEPGTAAGPPSRRTQRPRSRALHLGLQRREAPTRGGRPSSAARRAAASSPRSPGRSPRQPRVHRRRLGQLRTGRGPGGLPPADAEGAPTRRPCRLLQRQ